MSSQFKHRLALRILGDSSVWHQRYYRPSVYMAEGEDEIWIEENGRSFQCIPLSVLKGKFVGRCNLLLSGPSVKKIAQPECIADNDWIGVNGSPALLADKDNLLESMRIYHVNDSTYLNGSLDDFLCYASAAEYTIIDYRGLYELLRLAPENMPTTKLVVYDSWSYPLHLPKGKIQQLVKPPTHRDYPHVCISSDFRLGLSVAGTVAFTASQIAWHGGYSEFYIYGLDLTNNGRFYSEKNAQSQMLDKAYSETILPGFELLAQETSKENFRMYNCNPSSRLPNDVISHIDPGKSFV